MQSIRVILWLDTIAEVISWVYFWLCQNVNGNQYDLKFFHGVRSDGCSSAVVLPHQAVDLIISQGWRHTCNGVEIITQASFIELFMLFMFELFIYLNVFFFCLSFQGFQVISFLCVKRKQPLNCAFIYSVKFKCEKSPIFINACHCLNSIFANIHDASRFWKKIILWKEKWLASS